MAAPVWKAEFPSLNTIDMKGPLAAQAAFAAKV